MESGNNVLKYARTVGSEIYVELTVVLGSPTDDGRGSLDCVGQDFDPSTPRYTDECQYISSWICSLLIIHNEIL